MSRQGSVRTAVFSLFSICFAHVVLHARAQANTRGFISIDCGSPPGSGYVDVVTWLPYVSDAQFVDAGVSHNISAEHADMIDLKLPRLYNDLRSFPTGARNCYTVRPLTPGTKYLVRATFLHGNYDGLGPGGLAVFDLHLGVNFWQTVNVSSVSDPFQAEIITVVPDDYVQVCLVGKKGLGTPFISGLELRPLPDTLYTVVANSSLSMAVHGRYNLGPDDEKLIIRYPSDPHDRIWKVLANLRSWNPTNTTGTVRYIAQDQFEAPSAVMQTAATVDDGFSLRFYWDAYESNKELDYFAVLHMAELTRLNSSEARICEIYLNNGLWYSKPFSPEFRYANAVSGMVTGSTEYSFRIEPTANSTLPPLLNALEIYVMVPTAERATDGGDVSAIMGIKAKYEIKKNWMGDPCGPKVYLWDGVGCNYAISSAPRITSLNLSSNGLDGEITTLLSNLTALQNLDLSHNILTGKIPEFLAQLPSLAILDLTGNKFNGSVPESLLKRSQEGALLLRIEANISSISNNQPKGTKRNSNTAVIVAGVAVVVFVLVVVVVIATLCLRRRRTENDPSVRPLNGSNSKEDDGDAVSMQFDNRQFSYKELKTITNSFEKSIGKGGFGVVYLGYLEDGTPVAVKTRSESSSQGVNEFLAEALHLIRVHHRNLVNLVGHCKDGQHSALVYEYMSEGNLQEKLREKTPECLPLTWRQRLRISLDSAQGLEYLHKACTPPLIHRDVKTANILLNGSNLDAKIADFGLSKAFNNDLQSHVSTRVVGTPGYLDPEYYTSFQLSEKSDVYSFGIVLLEVVTGRPPILPESVHIVQWARQRLAKGDIESVVDDNMQGRYDLNSVWKVADLALRCTEQASSQRPAMADVVVQLKESLELEEGCERVHGSYTGSGSGSGDGYAERSDAASQSTQSGRVLDLVSGPAAR
ncbi:probable LRR receptor-like serine/threonine-protein kinase At4g29180 isoform X2 [Hordeum vulgare subsp. vulgare]|uniref:non-specific serine/threonine protein kinase n=1 Tax=Hordeum vulgare subsp. vulgare TaxID=112509 RepID=A0A8I7B5Q1_HORVV|nr:probable LRR receptor-like serine/threonine-protein kinase At4g29180 isoform X2 [Hordeum vulgare subsp. vulgare]